MQVEQNAADACRCQPPDKSSLRSFKTCLDELLTRNPGPEVRISALLDFFGTRCVTARELRHAGKAVVAAINSTKPSSAVFGRYHERYSITRLGDDVEFGAGGQHLATLRLDEAIRLATLLQGVSDATVERLRAA